MQFKYPELLFALFLLLIPIFIHLFQLRRFQKTSFTNVAFLKKVTLQTRKSSRLKKWLTLCTRLLALACLIFAFAQPFTASETAVNAATETVLYIDNSQSMQAKGSHGPLLQRALQEIFEHSKSQAQAWFTNDSESNNNAAEDFKNEILKTEFSANQLSPTEVLLKAEQLFSKRPETEKRLVYISDFQQRGEFPEIPENVRVQTVQLKAVSDNNLSIDSVSISGKTATTAELKVTVSGRGTVESVPVSLYNGDILVAKTAITLSEKQNGEVSFSIENGEGFKGKLEITDPNLGFDNSLFFSLNAPQKIKVLSINAANPGFLKKLFNNETFDYNEQKFDNLDHNLVPEQHFIVLNELKTIPVSLRTSLKVFVENGGSLFIIPGPEIDIENYNLLLSSLRLGQISASILQEKSISKIAFSHPLYADVFEKEVTNFQFPTVNSFYEIAGNASPALRFQDGKPFLLQQGNSYFATSAINTENSNLQNSPLIVPTLLNMAQQSLPLPRLYYTIGTENTFSVPVKLQQNEILKLKKDGAEHIPLQQTKENYVAVTIGDQPEIAGNYEIVLNEKPVAALSLNYDRAESKLPFAKAEDWAGAEVFASVDSLFEKMADENSIHGYWKWFVIFALIFLIFEMLILKFLP